MIMKLRKLLPALIILTILSACAISVSAQKKRGTTRKKSTATELPVRYVTDEKGKFKCIKKKRGENYVNIMVPVSFTNKAISDVDVIEGMLVQDAFGDYGTAEAAARKFLALRFTPSFDLWDRGVSISPYSISDDLIQFRVLTNESSGNSAHAVERYFRYIVDSDGELNPVDFVKSEDKPQILQAINARIREMNSDKNDPYYDALQRADNVPDSYRFDKDGVTFWFYQGDITAMVYGDICVTVSYDELSPYMSEYIYSKVSNSQNTKYYPLLSSTWQ